MDMLTHYHIPYLDNPFSTHTHTRERHPISVSCGDFNLQLFRKVSNITFGHAAYPPCFFHLPVLIR